MVSGRSLIGINIHWNIVYCVYGSKLPGRTQQDEIDWVCREKALGKAQRNEKHWVHKKKIEAKTQLNEKDWVHKSRNVLYTQCRGKR